MLRMATAITPGSMSPCAVPWLEGLVLAPHACGACWQHPHPAPCTQDPFAGSTHFICAVHMVSSCPRYLPFPLMQ